MSKKKAVLRAADYQAAQDLAAAGMSDEGMARELRVSVKTWRDIRVNDPKLAEAIAVGHGREHDDLVAIVRTEADKGNWRAAKFLLESRHGYGEKDAAPVAVGIRIELPSSVSREEWQKLINVTPEEPNSTSRRKKSPRL